MALELKPPVSDVAMLALDVGNNLISESHAVERWACQGVVLDDEQMRQVAQTEAYLLDGDNSNDAWVLAKLVLAAAARQNGQSRESPWWRAADEFIVVTMEALNRTASGRRLADAMEVVEQQLSILRTRLAGELPEPVRVAEHNEYLMTLLAAGDLIAQPYLLHSATGELGLRRWFSSVRAEELTLTPEIGRERGDLPMPDAGSAFELANEYFLTGVEESTGHFTGLFLCRQVIVRERLLALAAEQESVSTLGVQPRDVVVRLAEQALQYLVWQREPDLYVQVLRLHFDSVAADADPEQHPFVVAARSMTVEADRTAAPEAINFLSGLAHNRLSRERQAYLWRTVTELLPDHFPASGRALLCEKVAHSLPEDSYPCPPKTLTKNEANLTAGRIQADDSLTPRGKASTLVHLAFHLGDEDHTTAISFLLAAEGIDAALSAEYFDCVEYGLLRMETRAGMFREQRGDIPGALVSYAVAMTDARRLVQPWRWPEVFTDLLLRIVECLAGYESSDDEDLVSCAFVVITQVAQALTVTLNPRLARPVHLLGILMDAVISRDANGAPVLLHHQVFKGAEFSLAAAVSPSHERSIACQLLLERLADQEKTYGPYVARDDSELEGSTGVVPSGTTALAYANFYEIVPAGPDDNPTGTLRRSIDNGVTMDLVGGSRRKQDFQDQHFDWKPREELQELLPDDTVLVSLYLGERTLADSADESKTAVLTCAAMTRDKRWAWRVRLNAFGGEVAFFKPNGRIRVLHPFAVQVAWVREAINADSFNRPATPHARQLLNSSYDQLGGPPRQYLEQWWAQGYRHLCFWPHGPLHFVPFSLLESDGQPLADRWTITTVPSDVLLVRPRTFIPDTEVQLTAVGAERGGVELGRSPLPVVKDHAIEVAAHFPGADVLVGPQATPANVRAAMTRSTYLHIAAHGSHDGEASWFQCLYLDGVESGDGRLFAHDILQLDLRHIRLVTLSACESAMGRFDRNDNLRGLPAAFLLAGADTVIGTLWPIATGAATTFFAELYERLADGASKRTAYRAAQIATRARFPAYRDWGAFTYIGDLR